MASRPSVMCRLSSLCAEKPNVMDGRSPLKLAPDMNGTNSRFVSRYSKLNPIAIRNSNGPARQRIVEERLRHRQVPDPVVHRVGAVHARVVLVVVATACGSRSGCAAARRWTGTAPAKRGPAHR